MICPGESNSLLHVEAMYPISDIHPGVIVYKRMTRLLAVGRLLFVTAILAGILCCRCISLAMGPPDAVAGYGIPAIYLGALVLFSILDARSRFQDYKRAKDLFFENGFRPRIAALFIHSRCQRDAARIAARDLGLERDLDRFFRDRGYRWYHILPDVVLKRPALILSRRYWRKTLFQPGYTSPHFLW